MIYHINVNVGKQLTGIESAAIQRHKLLKKKHDSKLVTIRFNTKLRENMRLYGLLANDYINMYDYFQKIPETLETTKIHLNDVFPKENYMIRQVGTINDFRIFKEDRYIAYASLNEKKQINYVNYFDENGKKIKRQMYDIRGFLSCESMLDDTQKPVTETYFSPKGEVCIVKHHQHEDIEKELSICVHGQDAPIVLAGEEELISLFYQKLFTCNDTVISDKNIVTAFPLTKVSKVGKKIAILHSKHYSGNDLLKGRITAPYKDVFSNLDHFDYIVCSTEQQRRDLIERFEEKRKFVCIPVGIRKDVQRNSLTIEKESTIRIGVVARYYVEKRLDHVIKAFKKIHCFLPNTELHLYGFGDAREKFKTEKELIQLTKQLNLRDSVKFRGYLIDLDSEYKKMHMISLTSTFEGFCLALLEGISYGIPAVSYDIKYGPREMIESGCTGELVNNGCIEELADKMIAILSDSKKYKHFSEKSFEKSKDFSEEKIRGKWEQLFPTEGCEMYE
ncbi:glycosyltransferase [Enterococcus sp. AZ196]|uniref:glycosyltransferase n=1 Tax=Enterococcus sp. AZ196 TaxID=2774659 RepID=UPI003D298DDF